MSNEQLPQVGQTTSAVASMLTGNQVTPTTGGGLPFLTFDSKRTGQWLFGRDREECTGEVFSLDVSSVKHGWILWHNKKANRRMVALNQQLPVAQEPVQYTDHKGKPAEDVASEARSFEGSFEDGTAFLFETSTFGGRKSVDELLAQLFTRAHNNSPYLFPQVQLENNSYEHSQYGLVYEPVLKAVAWFDEQGNEEGKALEDQSAAPSESAPETGAETPDDEPAPEGQGRRRRRRG